MTLTKEIINEYREYLYQFSSDGEHPRMVDALCDMALKTLSAPAPLSIEAVGKGDATIFDACCGSKMFWFDREDPRVIFMDKRRERHELKDKSSRGGSRTLIIEPDIQGDFTAMPFEDGKFSLICFDPPHLVQAGKTSWLAKKYGVLGKDWRVDLAKGFAECFRVLAPAGTLIFKWNENQIKIADILALTPEKPLWGSRHGRDRNTHWIVFQKPLALLTPSPIEREKQGENK